uniref:Uncharacterized protein n=1 Tax=Globodera rostochiensis TaxID=31243 RepID=A0A914I6Q5_GLORO
MNSDDSEDKRRLFEYFIVAGLNDESGCPKELSSMSTAQPSSADVGKQTHHYQLAPITDICVIFTSPGETATADFDRIETTPQDYPADLNHGSGKRPPHTFYKIPKNQQAEVGGAPIAGYVVEKLDTATGRWVKAGRTDGPDTKQFTVDGLQPGYEYKFRVSAVNRYGESDPLEASKSVVAKDPFETADRPGTPDIVDWDKNWADLKWTPPTDDGGAPLEKYVVEKRMGNGEWEYATEVPTSKTGARVDGLVEGKQYQFRVKGVNKAGESAPSNPSRTLLAKARRLAPTIDRSAMPEIRIKKGGTIEFNVPVEGEPGPKCQWLINGTQLGTSDRTKVDNSNKNNTKLRTLGAERMDSGTYKLIATNEHGQDEADVLVVVLDVPRAPNGPLEARDVTNDSATVNWYTPDDDGGSPITHYAVERQEGDGGRWVPCGEMPDTQLRVNRLVEGKAYKFRVKAVNRQGESKPLAMERSVVAKNPWETPGKPQDVKVVDWDKDHMDLEWKAPVTDGGAPIDGYVIEKKTKTGPWIPCAQIMVGWHQHCPEDHRMKLVFVLSICVLFGVMFGLGEAHYYGGYGSYWPSMYGSYGYGYGGGWGGWPYYGYGYYGKRSVGFEPGEEKSKRN